MIVFKHKHSFLVTMETDELPVLDPNVDFRQVPPIHQKRSIAFINHFIMRTVSFLNTFAETCETRLMEFDYKLQNIEASLLILESQLSSVPWLDEKNEQPSEIKPNVVENDEIKTLDLPEIEHEQVDTATSVNGPKACEDPRFVKFFKMVQFGVPFPAVKLKMESEGLDSTVLDNPNNVIPGFDSSNDS